VKLTLLCLVETQMASCLCERLPLLAMEEMVNTGQVARPRALLQKVGMDGGVPGLRFHPGVRPVGIRVVHRWLRRSRRAHWRLYRTRIVERAFGIGSSMLAEAVALIEEKLNLQPV